MAEWKEAEVLTPGWEQVLTIMYFDELWDSDRRMRLHIQATQMSFL